MYSAMYVRVERRAVEAVREKRVVKQKQRETLGSLADSKSSATRSSRLRFPPHRRLLVSESTNLVRYIFSPCSRLRLLSSARPRAPP